jgi:Fe-S oxidoreductase
MCPSYMATREEMHSTRGRARLLFEMLEGNPLNNGWQNETVKEALDLCLACKGCKANARSKSTSRRTRRNFFRITTRVAAGRWPRTLSG